MNEQEKKLMKAKYMHVTLHKIKNSDKNFWLQKGKTFRANVQAVLVGIEENHEEGKGLHSHIFLQFTTQQQLSRKQFVDHFGTDSLHISTRKKKDDLLQGLGYVSKTGNTAQFGTFSYRGVELDTNPEVYRFNYQVKNKIDAIKYFQKVIDERIKREGNFNVIKEYAKRNDDIGAFLVGHPSITKSLHKLAHTWFLDQKNEAKVGFSFAPCCADDLELEIAYKNYLREYPEFFKNHLVTNSTLTLEDDFRDHAEEELKSLKIIIDQLRDALKYGPNRPLKSMNLFIWSRKPSFGKTRLLNFLDHHMMAYRLPDDQFYVDYENNLYQVLVSDEAASFIKTKTYSHLKHILEGQKVEFNLKGREKIYKEDNPFIILADNMSFDDLMDRYFNGRYEQDIMATRIRDIELHSRATLHFFLDRCLIPNTPQKK